MYKIQKENRYYARAILHEGKQWAQHEPTIHMNYDQNIHLSSYFNRRIDPERGEEWLHYVSKRYGPFKTGCSLGCGAGKTEEEFVGYAGFQTFDFFDVSEGALQKLKDRIDEKKTSCKINIAAADLNFVQFKENSYDLVLCNSILHHLINLEHVLSEIGKALKPDGIFVIRDFVGENRFQWTDAKLALANFFREEFKNRHNKAIGFVECESLSDVVEASPFEAIRSQEIPELVHKFFPESLTEVQTEAFCSAFLWGIDLADPKNEPMIEFAVETDQVLSKHGILIPTAFFGVYKKPKGLPPIKVEPYSDSELRRMFAENLFSKRRIRNFLLGSKLGASFYGLLRTIKKLVRTLGGS